MPHAERWQKPDPHSPGQTLGESVMQQFGFRYGVGQLWLGVGVAIAWNVVMVAASFLCLIFLNREPKPPQQPCILLWSGPCTPLRRQSRNSVTAGWACKSSNWGRHGC